MRLLLFFTLNSLALDTLSDIYERMFRHSITQSSQLEQQWRRNPVVSGLNPLYLIIIPN